MTTEATEQQIEDAFLKAAGEMPAESKEEEVIEQQEQEEQQPQVIQLTPQELEERIKAAREEAEFNSTKRIRDLSGEVGALRQKLDQLATAKAATSEAGADTPTNQQIKEAAQSQSKMEALREDFPEWADAYDEERAKTQAELEAIKKTASEAQQRADATAEELQLTRVYRALDRALPTWEDEIQTPAYAQWLNKQPREIQEAANLPIPDPASASFVIKKYLNDTATERAEKESAATAKSKRDDRLNAAITPTDGKPTLSRRALTAEEAFQEAAKKHGYA